MAKNWEDTFRFWGRPPSPTEQSKCENAERGFGKLLPRMRSFLGRTSRSFCRDSYRNRTNVRTDSDVDVCVCCHDVLFYDLPDSSMTMSDVGMTPATYSYAEFKSDLGRALTDYFGERGVTRGNKAFDIHENTYRIDADVVATFEYRRYTHRGMSGWLYLTGTEFRPDSGGRVINWPEQHYANGVSKNAATGKRFKAIARVLKNLRNEMVEEGIAEAEPMASFLLESLAFNVPDSFLMTADFTPAVSAALTHLYNSTLTYDQCSEWGEVNELKYLFRSSQPWTFQQVNAFTRAAWNYAELG